MCKNPNKNRKIRWNGNFLNAELIQRFLAKCDLWLGLDLFIITGCRLCCVALSYDERSELCTHYEIEFRIACDGEWSVAAKTISHCVVRNLSHSSARAHHSNQKNIDLCLRLVLANQIEILVIWLIAQI